MSIRNTVRGAAAALAMTLALAAIAGDTPRVDINTADAETIAEVLVGVGLAKARAIIEYRNENGRFTDVYELTAVKGIGDSIVERNEQRISLETR